MLYLCAFDSVPIGRELDVCIFHSSLCIEKEARGGWVSEICFQTHCSISSVWETLPNGRVVCENRNLFVVKSERKFFFSLSYHSVPQHVKCILSPSSGVGAPPKTKAKSLSWYTALGYLAPVNLLLLDFEERKQGCFKGVCCSLSSPFGLDSLGCSVLSPYRSELMPPDSSPWAFLGSTPILCSLKT